MKLLPRTLNLRQRLTLLLLVASVPGMAVATGLAVNALAVQSHQIEQMATHLAALQAAQQTTVIESARIMLDTLIQSEAIAGIDEAECGAFLSDWIERYPSFTALALIDADGEVLCSSVEAELPFDPAGRPWFAQLKSEKAFTVGQYAVGREGTPMVMAGQPLLDAQGAVEGAVALGIDLRWLEFLARRVELPARATVTALGSDGQVLVHFVEGSETAAPADPASDPAPSEALRKEMATLGTGTVRGLNQAREPRVYGFHGADSGGLVVAVGLPPYLAFARYGAALRDTLTAPLMILVLALAAAWWGAERLITRWVRSLTRAAGEMAHGDLSARSKVPHSRYEIGQLAAAFDTMARNMERCQSGLRQAVAERETLLRELNHRVKNNLQMVISLLNLHARKFTEPGVRGQFRDITGRIQTLSVVHELLYQGEQTQTALPDYVGRLCQALHDLYQVQPDSAQFETLLEPVSLPLDQAIPFGMILTELVSNAYKHAFPEGRSGRVEIRLAAEGEEPGQRLLHLSVSDTGSGPPPEFDVASSPSMGLRVARALAESLGGALTFERKPGLSVFHLQFPLKAGAAAAARPRS